MTDWFWEGNVQDAVVAYLERNGWTIEVAADTASRARGIDIVASNGRRRLAVEVKGFPGTTYARGPKAGQPKPTPPTLQARHWYAETLLTSLLTRSKHSGYELALAFPDMPRFHKLLDETSWALERLGVGVYLVREDGAVNLFLDHSRSDRATTRFVVPTEGIADWRALLADPKEQWKPGFSAKALAHCWEGARGFPESVRAAFAAAEEPLFYDLELLLAIPEHRVALPGGSRASQNDLFVLARSPGTSALIAIAVEGKVAESFDETVDDWRMRRAADEARKGRPEVPSAQAELRLRFLCQLLELDEATVGGLRYQLLHRAASALLEAQRFGAAHATMLVHSFSQSDSWFDDYAYFADRMGSTAAAVGRIVGVGTRADVALYLGWVRGEARYLEV